MAFDAVMKLTVLNLTSVLIVVKHTVLWHY
jgi:hypothetical protein